MMCGRCNCECSLERWLRVADLLWVWFVVGPLAIFYWGGTWKLMDDYLVPHEDDTKTSAYISLAIGATVGFIAYMILPFVEETVEVRCHWKHVTVSRIIIYIQNFSTVNFWRGVWYLMDSYVGAGLTPSLVALCLSLLFLLVLRATSTAIATPFTINLDTRTTFYHTAPLFRSTPDSVIRYTVDSAVSHFIIVPLVVQVWRGLWNILDIYIYPENLVLSYSVCLGVGYAAMVLLFMLEWPLVWLAKKLHQRHWFLELVFEDIYKLLTILASLLLWRGGWGFVKDYLLVTQPLAWTAHGVGTVFMMLLQVASTISAAAILRDCEFGQGTGIPFKVAYFTHFYDLYSAHRRRMMLNEDLIPPRERQGLLARSDSSDEDDYIIN